MSRAFFRLDGSARSAADLDAWLRVGSAQLGPVRGRHVVPAVSRPVLALLMAVAVVTTLLLVAVLLAAVTGMLPVTAILCPLAVAAATAMLVVPLVLATRDSRTIEVRAHGLVIGSRAVPFATMDPGRFVWATSARAARAVVTRNRRRRVAGGDCLLLNGTDGADALEDWKGLGGKYDPLPRAPRLDTPFVWWVLGPKDVGALVLDLEEAMVADGYPVRGLAARLGEHRVDVPTGREAYPRRAPHDPPLWRG